MAETKVIFTKAQEAIIQEMIDRVRRIPIPAPLGDEDKDDYQSPQVHIVKTPVAGIAAISTAGTGSGTAGDPAAGDTPGSADCEVYRIDSAGVTQQIDSLSPYTITVYNITEFKIRGDILIHAKRDKYGTWIAERPALAIFRGKTTADVLPGSSGDLYVYEGTFGSEAATGRVIPQVRNDSSCTIKASLIATIIEVPDNGKWQFLIGKTA